MNASVPTHEALQAAIRAAGRIRMDPGIASGLPVVEGTRLGVDFVLGLETSGLSEAEILDQYPQLKAEDLAACRRFASILAQEVLHRAV
jgi:uncharacterized protein (DUF433 family)